MDNNTSPYQPAPVLPPPQPNPSPTQTAVPIPAKKKRSFAWLPWLLVVLLILAVVGVYLWQHKKVTDLQDSKTAGNTSAVTTSPGGRYLYMYDYGIKVPLTNSIRDLYYVSLRSKQVNGDELSFSSEILTNEDIACSALPVGQGSYSYDPASDTSGKNQQNIKGAPLGTVTITTAPLQKNLVGSADGQYGDLVSHVDSAYLYFRSPMSACSSNSNASQTQTQQKADLQMALKNTQSI